MEPPISVRIFFTRSCVMGRAILIPSISVAIAVASERPIQIGRLSLLSVSFRITIGVLVTGSNVRPPTAICMESSLFDMLTPLYLCCDQLSDQRVGPGRGDANPG